MIEARSNRAIVERKRSELPRATADLEEAFYSPVRQARNAFGPRVSSRQLRVDAAQARSAWMSRSGRHREALAIRRNLDDRRGVGDYAKPRRSDSPAARVISLKPCSMTREGRRGISRTWLRTGRRHKPRKLWVSCSRRPGDCRTSKAEFELPSVIQRAPQ